MYVPILSGDPQLKSPRGEKGREREKKKRRRKGRERGWEEKRDNM